MLQNNRMAPQQLRDLQLCPLKAYFKQFTEAFIHADMTTMKEKDWPF